MSKWSVPKATTATRLAGIPKKAEILCDKEEEAFYGGDGHTAGGKKFLMAHTKTTAFVYGVDRDAPLTAVATDSHRVVLDMEYDYADADPADRYKRLQDSDTFSKMPVHNLRRCIVSDLKDAKNNIYAYLNPSTSLKKNDGTSLTASELSGAAGDFCVHMPKFYVRYDTYMDGSTKRYVYLVSLDEFTGSMGHPWFYSGPGGDQFEDQFVGAFPSVVCNSDGTIKAQDSDNCPVTLGSSDILRSIPGGRPAASIACSGFRAGHGRAGGLTDAYIQSHPEYAGTVTSVDDFFFQCVILLMMIDFNSLDFKSALSKGFAYCKTYRYAAQRLTGRTLSLGNGSGEVLADDAGLDVDIAYTPAYITAASVVYDRYPDGDSSGVCAWKYGTNIRYTATDSIVANTTKCYTNVALTTGETLITAYTAAGTNWNNDAVSNPALKVVAMSWRGFENIYAAIWCNVDGIQKNQDNTEADITSDGTVYNRYIDGDYTSGSFHSYAWKNGSTTIYTKNPHPAVNEATYSDQTCETNRNKNVTEWDEDFSQSGYWTTNDSTLYYKMDSDQGVGSESGALPASGHTGNQIVWVHHEWPKAGGYVIRFDPKTFLPLSVGGQSDKNLAAYFYNDTAAGARLVRRGGGLSNTAVVSPASVYVSAGLGYADPAFGSRLAAHAKRQTSAS